MTTAPAKTAAAPAEPDFEGRSGGDLVLKALAGAAAGAFGVWALDRADWFMWNRESDDTRNQTIAARPGGEPPAQALVSRIEGATGRYLDDDRHEVFARWSHPGQVGAVRGQQAAGVLDDPGEDLVGIVQGRDPEAAWASDIGALRTFAEACDGVRPWLLVEAAVDSGDLDGLEAWLRLARSCEALGLEGEAGPWLEQVHAEARLGLLAVKLLRARAVAGQGRPGEVLGALTVACGEGAVEILYRSELSQPEKIAARTRDYEDRFANPFVAAEKGFIDEVIQPHSTRKRVARALASLRTKQLSNPWKKHDNIPL